MPDSILKQCGDAIVSQIQGLTLATAGGSLETTEVKLRKTYMDGNQMYRGISVVPVPEREAPGTNLRDDYGYGFLIVMNQGTGRGISEGIDIVTLWRQQIKKLFNNRRLTGVTEVCICTVELGDVFMPKQYQASLDVGSFVVRCWARETRT